MTVATETHQISTFLLQSRVLWGYY